jgi:hypothetical protein
VKVKFQDFFPGLSRPFFSKFKDLELGKIFENNSLHSVILIKTTNVGRAGGQGN